MSLRVNNNIAAMNAYRNLSVTDVQQGKQLEKLSSGFRINRAADDAAGLSISEGLRSQVSGLNVAVRNAQDGISLTQTAEGALSETTSLLQRVRDLSVQAANGTNNAASRKASADEASQALSEIDRISSATKFGGKTLLDGTQATSGVTFQVGADATPTSNQVTVKIGDMSSTGLGVNGTKAGDTSATFAGATIDSTNNTFTVAVDGGTAQSLTLKAGTVYTADAAGAKQLATDLQAAADEAGLAAKFGTSSSGALTVESAIGGAGSSVAVTNGGPATGFSSSAVTNTLAGTAATGSKDVSALIQQGSTAAIDAVDKAVSSVSSQRATLGAYQNRLEHTIANLSVTAENLSASESRIRDADMAKEMVGYTRTQILSQAGTAMLAQANQSSQGVLSLLR